MVDVSGHLAMGLLWATPAWFVWRERRRVTLAFLGIVLPAALLPDVDLPLQAAFPGAVHHHGATHTVVFVVLAGVAVGGLAAALAGPLDRRFEGHRLDRGSPFTFAFAAAATVLGGLSHLFADVLSAPDVASPIEPFWPFVDGSPSIDVIWYNSPWWNVGLLIVAVVLHLGLAYATGRAATSSPPSGSRDGR